MSFETPEKLKAKPDLFKGNQWELPTDIDLVNKASEELERRLLEAGWGDESYPLVISFSEALINAIVHGNLEIKEKPETESWREVALRVQKETLNTKKIFINLNITSEEISITIKDEGNGFAVKEIADPTGNEGISKTSGRGFLFMHKDFDSVVHNEKGNEVTMKKAKQETP